MIDYLLSCSSPELQRVDGSFARNLSKCLDTSVSNVGFCTPKVNTFF